MRELDCVRRTVQNALLGGLLTVAASPQQPATFRSTTDLVTVSCAVLDSSGRAVRDLSAGDFRVYDNGRRRLLKGMWLESDSPLVLGVIVDATDSQHSKLEEHRQTAMKVLEQALRPGDRAFVISLGEEVRVWADLTGDPDELHRRLGSAPGELFGNACGNRMANLAKTAAGCGSTPLWDGIYDAARLKLRPITGNKALLLITDGFDIGSAHSWRQAADEVHSADASVYAIQYRSDLGGTFPQELYRLLSEAGGTWFTEPRGDYAPIVRRLNTDLRDRYILGFPPDKLSAGIRHEIRVETTRPELTIRARKTYYWNPE